MILGRTQKCALSEATSGTRLNGAQYARPHTSLIGLCMLFFVRQRVKEKLLHMHRNLAESSILIKNCTMMVYNVISLLHDDKLWQCYLDYCCTSMHMCDAGKSVSTI